MEIYSLILGYSKYKNLTIKRPTTKIEYNSSLVYNEVYQEALTYTLTFSQLLEKLYEKDLWDLTSEGRFNDIPKLIEDKKVELYLNRNKSETVKSIKSNLDSLRNEFSLLFTQRHAYDSYSAEGVANYIKLISIVKSCTFFKGKLYKFNEDLDEIVSVFQANTLSEEKIRSIGRNEVWLGYWTSFKAGVGLFKDLTDEQRKLIRIATFYDNLRSSPDCPPDFVIEDDDMLDGFLINKRREDENEQNSNDLESGLSEKVRNSKEIYIMCDNEEDAKRIHNMNNAYAKAAISAREKKINETGRVNEVDLPDVRKELLMSAAKVGIYG